MTSSSLALTLAAAVTFGPSLAAQARGPASRPAGAGSIAGRVNAADTGSPARGAEVTAFLIDGTGRLTNPAAHQTLIADDEGRFRFDGLPLGSWTLTASKTGYITWQFGQTRPFETPPPIVLSRGRERVTADIRIPRASVITGRVLDELGEPVSSARVTVYRARMAQGRRQLQPVGRPDTTDDTGAFRVYGLAPGQYYVGASLRVAPADSIVETTYAPTYYPGTGNLAEARRVSLDLGSESHVEFQLLPLRRLRVTGSVFTSSGAPASALLNLVSDASELGVPLGTGGATRGDGSFTIADVAPGRYTLQASLRGGERDESAEMPLVVGLGDVSGLTLVTAPPALIRGTIAAGTDSERPLPAGVGVTARSARGGGPMTAGTVEGSRFEVASPGGPFRIEVHGLPPAWIVKSVEIGGVDATDVPVELRGQQDVEARIVLSDRAGEMFGTLGSDGARYTVVAFPQDPARWSNPARYIRSARADTRGAFRLPGLLPGEPYLVVAVDYLDEGEEEDPDFLSIVAPRATGVSLGEGERRAIAPMLVRR